MKREIIAAALALSFTLTGHASRAITECDPNAGECGTTNEANYASHEAYAVAQGWRAAYTDGECMSDWWHFDHMPQATAEDLIAQCESLGLDDAK